MAGLWLENKTCSCSAEVRERSGVVTVDDRTYCKFCRGSMPSQPSADDSELDVPKFMEYHSTQEAYDAEPGPIAATPAVVRTHGIWQFKIIYGVHDPVLWIALFISIPGVLRDGIVATCMTFAIALIVLDLVRWPIAALTRSLRLNRHRPHGATVEEWLVDPARLGTYRLWTGQAWSNRVAGPPQTPSANKRITVAAICGGFLALLTIAMFVSVSSRSTSTSLSASPALATVRSSIATVDSKQTAYNAALDTAIESPSAANQAAVVTALGNLKSSMQTVQLQVAALPTDVPSDTRSKLNAYVSTGNAAVAVEDEIIQGSLACSKKRTPSAAQACISALDNATTARERQALTTWRDSIVALGYQIR